MRRANLLTSVSSYTRWGLPDTQLATASMGAARPIKISGLKRRAATLNCTDSLRNKKAFSTGFLPVDLAQRV